MVIGIVGPADSVALAQEIADASGFADRLVTRVYRLADEAVDLASEVDASCNVVLFTGQLPYMLAGVELAHAEGQYISHSGADLYRCVSRVLIERNGTMPVVSVDSMDEATVLGSFADLGLPEPTVHPLGSADDGDAPDGIADVIAFHRDALASGRATAVLTCLAEVHAKLREEGATVWRIDHTIGTVADALQRARLSDQLIRSRAEQLAVVLFAIDRAQLASRDVYEREMVRMRVHRELLEVARRNGGRLTALEGGVFSIAVSRRTVDDDLLEELQPGPTFDMEGLGVDVRTGIGIGSTFEEAEHVARAALERAHDTGRGHVAYPDGRVTAIGASTAKP